MDVESSRYNEITAPMRKLPHTGLDTIRGHSYLMVCITKCTLKSIYFKKYRSSINSTIILVLLDLEQRLQEIWYFE